MKRWHKIMIDLFIFLLFVSLLLVLTFAFKNPENPIFSIESTKVKAFNLTVDNKLFCIINLKVRVQNPNPTKDTFEFKHVDMEVRKGVHHALANDALQDFSLGLASEAVVQVEAVGLHVEVEGKISTELVADLVAGEGRVNVYLSGNVGPDGLGVTCKNVTVDFSWSTVRVQSVDCEVSVSHCDYLRVFVQSLIVSIGGVFLGQLGMKLIRSMRENSHATNHPVE